MENYQIQLKQLYTQFQEFLQETPGNEIPQTLIEIDELVRGLLDGKVSKDRSERKEQEEKIFVETIGEKVSIDELLGNLAERVSQILKKDINKINQELKIFTIDLQEIILPPGKGEVSKGTGESQWIEKPELEYSRYGRIIEILRQNNIYADDIIVYTGKNKQTMMRETSYFVIQIPKLLKTIFVCDEYGEASFIVDSIVNPEVFTSHTKSDIRENLNAEKIIHSQNWETKFVLAFFGSNKEENKKGIKKVDVREWQMYVDEIKRLYPTPESFMHIKGKKLNNIVILGASFYVVGNLLHKKDGYNIKFNPIGYPKNFANLAKIIYGEGYDIIDCVFWDKMMWIEYFKRLFPDEREFMSLSQKEKLQIDVLGKGLKSFSSIVFEKNLLLKPVNYKKDQAILAREIYGYGNPYIDSFFWNKEEWIREIKKQFISPDLIVRKPATEKGRLDFYGNSFIDIARIILPNYKDLNPVKNIKDCVRIAIEIYGLEISDQILCELYSREEWKAKIKYFHPSKEFFLKMPVNERYVYKFLGKTLDFIGYNILNPVPKDRFDRFTVRNKTHFETLINTIYGDEIS